MDIKLNQIISTCRPLTAQGHTANYIPELAGKDPDRLGLYLLSQAMEIILPETALKNSPCRAWSNP